ncbi:MAG: nitrous oxide reductase family maturation protein NosD [Planctomycetota bacterium]
MLELLLKNLGAVSACARSYKSHDRTDKVRIHNVLLLLFSGLICFSGAAAAQTVPDDFATIQEAVDNAGNGATITIKKGTYNENVIIDNKPNISIIGKGKPVISGGIGAALTITNTNNAFITGITVRNSGARGIHVTNCTDVTFSKCAVSDISGNGIDVEDCDGIVIELCTISNPAGHGIQLSTGKNGETTNSTINKCKINSTADDGIHIRGSNNIVNQCTITDPGADGIGLEDGAAGGVNNQFIKNKIVSAGGDGIRLQGTGHSVTQNKISDSIDDGIRVSGDGHTIHKNIITNTVEDGISVRLDAINMTISQNRITGSSGDGINIRAGAVNIMLLSNSVSNSAGDGIDIELSGDGHTLTSNKCTKSGGDGIQIGGEDNIITLNTASGSLGLDLRDQNGAPGFNSYSGNKVKTSNIAVE